jgi:hypothetical protein
MTIDLKAKVTCLTWAELKKNNVVYKARGHGLYCLLSLIGFFPHETQ